MKLLSKILILIAIIAISGCFKNTDNEYNKQIYHPKPLIIPNDLNKDNIDNYYPIPDVEKTKSNKVSLIPPGSKLTKE